MATSLPGRLATICPTPQVMRGPLTAEGGDKCSVQLGNEGVDIREGL